MDSIPKKPPARAAISADGSSPPKPTDLKEGARLGAGTYGVVSAMLVGEEMRAVKILKVGSFTDANLELQINKLGLACIPRYIPCETIPHLKDHLVSVIAPLKLQETSQEALPTVIFLCEALHAVTEAYGKEIVHRDLKPAHIVINSLGDREVIDWGSATVTGMPEKIDGRSYTPVGTPGYIPPEAYYYTNPITVKFDSWAIGIILFKLLSGKPPYEITNKTTAMELMLTVMRLSKSEVRGNEFQRTIAALKDDPARDQSIPEGLYKVMEGLLEIDPTKRLTPDEALTQLRSLSNPAVSAPPGSSPNPIAAASTASPTLPFSTPGPAEPSPPRSSPSPIASTSITLPAPTPEPAAIAQDLPPPPPPPQASIPKEKPPRERRPRAPNQRTKAPEAIAAPTPPIGRLPPLTEAAARLLPPIESLLLPAALGDTSQRISIYAKTLLKLPPLESKKLPPLQLKKRE